MGLRGRGRRVGEQGGGLFQMVERFGLALRPARLAQEDDRLRRALAVAPGEEGVPRVREDVGAGRLGVEEGLAVAEEQLRPFGVVFGQQVEGAAIEAHRSRERVEPRHPVACLAERETGALGKRFRSLPGRTRKVERGQVVVGEHLGAVLGPLRVQGLDPLGREPCFSPRRPRGIWP